ncbi:MAG TPA: TolC family protein [Prolixibacteraceae bacterium]|jgi:outer membrane protein TolC
MLSNKLIAFVLFLVSGFFVNAQSLDYFIQKGLANSPLLKDYSNQLASGKLDSLLVQANYKPQVNQVSQIMYAPTARNFGYDEAITNGANYSAVINVVQPLFNKKIRNNQFRNLSLLNQTIETEVKITETDLRKGITSQYLTAYADYTLIQFNQHTLDLLKDEQVMLKSLTDQGIYPQTDLMNLSISVTAQEITIRQAVIQYKNSLAVLNFICGMNDTSAVMLNKPELTIQNSFNMGSLPAMMKFRIDSLKNENSKRLIDLNYRPKLSAFADAGFMAILPQNIPHNFGTSVGLNFSVPVYDGRQRKLQVDKTLLAENSRLDYKAFYTLQYKQQINQLTEQLKLTDELIVGIRHQLSEQEKLIALYKIEIEKGLVRFLDFLTTVNNYTQTKNSLTVSEMNRLQIINQMNYLK